MFAFHVSVEYPALCLFRRGVEVEVKSCGSSLFAQIAKKRPLALALTRTVQEFRFVSWWPCNAGWWTSNLSRKEVHYCDVAHEERQQAPV